MGLVLFHDAFSKQSTIYYYHRSVLSVRNFTVRYALIRGKGHLKDYFSLYKNCYLSVIDQSAE